MKSIALFFPATISICIYCKRQSVKLECRLDLLIRYIIYAMAVDLCSASFIIYILRVPSANGAYFESFGFFTKYLFIAFIFAWLIPYVEEIIKKYIHIDFQIEAKGEKVYENKDSNKENKDN